MAETAKQVLKVKAHGKEQGPKWVGYYEHKRRKDGDIFILTEPSHFSAKWMEPIGWTPEGYDAKTRVVTKKPATKPLPRTPLSRTQTGPNAGQNQGPSGPENAENTEGQTGPSGPGASDDAI